MLIGVARKAVVYKGEAANDVRRQCSGGEPLKRTAVRPPKHLPLMIMSNRRRRKRRTRLDDWEAYYSRKRP